MPEGQMDMASPWGPDQPSVPFADLRWAGALRRVAWCGAGQRPDQNPRNNSDQIFCKTHLVPSGGRVRSVPMSFQDGVGSSPCLVPTTPPRLPAPLSLPPPIPHFVALPLHLGLLNYLTPRVGAPAPCSSKCGPHASMDIS